MKRNDSVKVLTSETFNGKVGIVRATATRLSGFYTIGKDKFEVTH